MNCHRVMTPDTCLCVVPVSMTLTLKTPHVSYSFDSMTLTTVDLSVVRTPKSLTDQPVFGRHRFLTLTTQGVSSSVKRY